MTNTIPNVLRKLKPCPFCGGEADPKGWMSSDGAQGPACDSCGATANSADEWNARAPSPAGVDGLDGVSERIAKVWIGHAHIDDLITIGKEVDATQAIIDGLRGENEALQAQVKVLQSDANSWQSGYDEGRRMGGKHCALTIDQQAQRIGELEGLLLACHTGLYPFDNKVLEREIDAALSAGKEVE